MTPIKATCKRCKERFKVKIAGTRWRFGNKGFKAYPLCDPCAEERGYTSLSFHPLSNTRYARKMRGGL